MVRPDLHLPPSFLAWLAPFLAAFSRRTRSTTAALATGALLAVGPRTVTNCLRALGLAEHPSANPPGFVGFTAFHRVLNRNAWSGLTLARTLLHMVAAAFVPSGPIIIGLDHTLERRRGPHIGPAGRFYDASRRADTPKPTSRGLRWLSAMVLVEVPFAGRIWGLPVLTALTPSKAWSERQGQRHRTVTEWARMVLLILRRWLPNRAIVAQQGWIEYTSGTAPWHHGGKPIVPILWVLVRYPDGRREPEAFPCTDTSAAPRDVLDCFNRRWAVETTYEEARAHLGMETQRQWSDPAIFRTTPVLLGLYSVVTLYVHQNAERLALSPRRAAWYPKPAPTFADAIARLRQHLWFERIVTSAESADMTEPISPAIQRIIEAACYAQ
jgi:hypothetical protein